MLFKYSLSSWTSFMTAETATCCGPLLNWSIKFLIQPNFPPFGRPVWGIDRVFEAQILVHFNNLRQLQINSFKQHRKQTIRGFMLVIWALVLALWSENYTKKHLQYTYRALLCVKSFCMGWNIIFLKNHLVKRAMTAYHASVEYTMLVYRVPLLHSRYRLLHAFENVVIFTGKN